MERSELALNLARKDSYPDYAFTGGYFNMGGMPAMYQFRADIKVPLQFGRRRAEVSEQWQNTAAARHEYYGGHAIVELSNRRCVSDGADRIQTDVALPGDRDSAGASGAQSSLIGYQNGKTDSRPSS